MMYFSAAPPKQQSLPAIGCNGPLLLPLELLVGCCCFFFNFNLVGHVEMLRIPFYENKIVDGEDLFLGFFQLLQQWGLDKLGHSQVTFAYLNIISANFQPDSYSHFALLLYTYK